ncbi:MAG: allantoicase [Acidimicrobiia bacterium]
MTTDLISERVGGRVVSFNDEFFAEAANLLEISDPVWKPDEFTDRGKWMDGWETRRRREPGHDWCVIALGIPGQISQVTIDTSHFTGNYPEEFSLEGCGVDVDARLDDAFWVELIGRTGLQGDSVARFDLKASGRISHVRLNIFPDGGVARLRVDGHPIPGIEKVCPEIGLVDLVSLASGGEPTDASDAHYSPPSNMLRPTEPIGMWDGWETRRRRGPGNDWVVFKLGMAGVVREAVVDTRYFKGNAPGWVSLGVSDDGKVWKEVLSRVEVEADSINHLVLATETHARWVKLDIHPDGGVARFRVMGMSDSESAGAKRLHYLNSLLGQSATGFFHTACRSTRWVSSMLASRPFSTVGEVVEAAEVSFLELEESDWLEAFAGHPRIGEKGDAVANREQAGSANADQAVLAAIGEVNRRYEEKFGFTYIVYATGKSAREMLAIAEKRIENSRETEIKIASREQQKITATRLRRMLCIQED